VANPELDLRELVARSWSFLPGASKIQKIEEEGNIKGLLKRGK
jgi:hypothetical protein